MANEDIKKQIKSIKLRDTYSYQNQSLLKRDHEMALSSLKAESLFHPKNDNDGPYNVVISVEENRLVFRIKNSLKQDIPTLVLSLKPYKRLIKDYFLIVESYEKALKDASPSKIEAIDMGRRGLHNEGAMLLMERLDDKIKMDENTARRLFTLICVLHAESIRLWS